MTGTALRRQRRAMGLTQVKLAKRLGVTSNTVARWERGEVGISGPAARLLRVLAAEASPKKKR